MKILHVITSLLTGGAEKLMVDLLPRIRTAGHEVELCVFDGTRTPFRELLEREGVRIHSFVDGVGKVYRPACLWGLCRLIRKGRYDIVHTHNTAPQLFAAICGVFSGVKLVTTEHNTTNRRRGKAWLRPVDRWMYGRYSRVICISDQAETNLLEHLPTLKHQGKVCIIYNGIDYHRYAEAKPANLKAYLKTPSPLGEGWGGAVITNVAAFRPQKDQPTLIRAMAYLPERFHLCLVGGDNAERQAMFERMIKDLGLQERVHLLGLRSDVPEILAASDYVVMCSHYEGLSLSSLEGMACGKPFLASDVDGLREIVKGNGVLFKHEDAEGFAEAILKLEADEEYRKEIIRKCQAKAAQYDISVMAEKYTDVYKGLV